METEAAVLEQEMFDLFEHALALLAALPLSAYDHDASLDLDERLDVVVEQLEARRSSVVRQADRSNTSRVPVGEALHARNRASRGEVMAQVKLARDLEADYPVLLEAWEQGRVSGAQVRAIVRGAKKLPTRLSVELSNQMQTELVGFAQSLDPKGLEQAAAHYYKILDPQGAQELEEQAAARNARIAQQSRSLSFALLDGAMHIHGQVPQIVGEQFVAQIEALLPTAASYRDAGQPVPSRAVRRADALEAWVGRMGTVEDPPTRAGERPMMYVTITAQQLEQRQGSARSIGTGELLDDHTTRTMACDATFARLVIGPRDEILSLGRSKRLISGHLRRALAARDKGCAFPSCDVAAMSCDGHHIIPWQQGGTTSLDNAVLLCPTHHRLVEPDPGMEARLQWQIHLDPDTGLPWFTPPATIRGARRAKVHQRHLITTTAALQQRLLEKPPNPARGENSAHTRGREDTARTSAGTGSAAPTTGKDSAQQEVGQTVSLLVARENSADTRRGEVRARLAPENDPWSPHYIPPPPPEPLPPEHLEPRRYEPDNPWSPDYLPPGRRDG